MLACEFVAGWFGCKRCCVLGNNSSCYRGRGSRWRGHGVEELSVAEAVRTCGGAEVIGEERERRH